MTPGAPGSSQPEPPRRYLVRMRCLAFVAALALLSCSDAFGPLTDGTPYALRAINGDTLPWSRGPGTPTSRIASGRVQIIDDARAERWERSELVDSAGTVVAVGEWGRAGSYTLRFGRLIIAYDAWPYGMSPPTRLVDTFFVSGKGLLLRETGFIAPLDTLVRYYAP